MTTDERLDRLTERVDALSHNLELLASLHTDLEKQTAYQFAKLNAELGARFAETLGFINRLAHVGRGTRTTPRRH